MQRRKYKKFKKIPDTAKLVLGVGNEELWYDRKSGYWLYAVRSSLGLQISVVEPEEANKIKAVMIQKANGDYHDWTEC